MDYNPIDVAIYILSLISMLFTMKKSDGKIGVGSIIFALIASWIITWLTLHHYIIFAILIVLVSVVGGCSGCLGGIFCAGVLIAFGIFYNNCLSDFILHVELPKPSMKAITDSIASSSSGNSYSNVPSYNDDAAKRKSNSSNTNNIIINGSGYNLDSWGSVENYLGEKRVFFRVSVPCQDENKLTADSSTISILPYISGASKTEKISMNDAKVKDWGWLDYEWLAAGKQKGTVLCMAVFKVRQKDSSGQVTCYDVSNVAVVSSSSESNADFNDQLKPIASSK